MSMMNEELSYYFVERYKGSNIQMMVVVDKKFIVQSIVRSLINADSMGAQSMH